MVGTREAHLHAYERRCRSWYRKRWECAITQLLNKCRRIGVYFPLSVLYKEESQSWRGSQSNKNKIQIEELGDKKIYGIYEKNSKRAEVSSSWSVMTWNVNDWNF